MTTGIAGWLIVIVTIVLANLPWFTDRVLFVLPTPASGKRVVVRLIEWLLLLVLTGFLAVGLERKMTGAVYPQGWEFYVVGICLFAVFSLPGIIWQVELKRRLKAA